MGYDDLPIYENPPPTDRVRGLLCSDQKGQVQIVARESGLINPEPILAATARDLKSIPLAENKRICATRMLPLR